MSQSGAQAAAFFRDIAAHGKVWTVCDGDGYPVPLVSGGRRSMPFWSSRSRAEKIIRTVPAYASMDPEEISLQTWADEWLPELRQEGHLVGINWSGLRAAGWDFEVDHVLARLEVAVPTKKPEVEM